MKSTLLRASRLCLLLLTLPACATTTRGSTQKMSVASEPSGAAVTVNGVDLGTTPVVLSLSRRTPHTLEVGAEGYRTETALLLPRPDYRSVLLNLLLFHPAIAGVGIGVDLVTGAHHRITPEAVAFNLTPTAGDAGPDAGIRTSPWSPVPVGSRVRVWSAGSADPVVVGTLLSVSGDTLLLRHGRSGPDRTMARSSVAALEVGVGTDRPAGALRGAGWGALAGLAAGFTVGTLAYGAEGGWFIGTLYGAPSGLIVGAVGGAAAAPKERWLRVPLASR